MFSFFKKKAAPVAPAVTPAPIDAPPTSVVAPVVPAASPVAVPQATVAAAVVSDPPKAGWFDRLKQGLRKTGGSIAQVFTGTRIDDTLYEDLESALLMADAGVAATQFLLQDLKRRVKETKATDAADVKALLVDAIAELLQPLERGLAVGQHTPTVIMVAGVNGAGKTTTIGKLTRHLAAADQRVLLAAADTFRAAAREQLLVWAWNGPGLVVEVTFGFSSRKPSQPRSPGSWARPF